MLVYWAVEGDVALTRVQLWVRPGVVAQHPGNAGGR